MANWSGTMKLSRYGDFEDFLRGRCGCYILGYHRGPYFYSKYIGQTNNLFRRMGEYMDPVRCHSDYVREKVEAERQNLWFQVLRTDRHRGLEARHQVKHGIRDEGIYIWNKRTEWTYLDA